MVSSILLCLLLKLATILPGLNMLLRRLIDPWCGTGAGRRFESREAFLDGDGDATDRELYDDSDGACGRDVDPL